MGINLKELFTNLGGIDNQRLGENALLSLLVIMLISLLSSLFLSFLYTRFYKGRATGSQIHRAFPLLGISVTAIFICIQFSLPLSLGLLGALSIVRFRTPIKEAEEIGFIMLVVAASICIATFNILFLGIVLIVAVLGLMVLNLKGGLIKGRSNDGMFIVTLPNGQYPAKSEQILNLLKQKLPKGRVDSITENVEESTISYSFIRMEENTLLQLQSQLKEITSEAKSNVFFNRAGEV